MPLNFLRKHKKILFGLADILLMVIAGYLSFLIRFEGKIPAEHYSNLYTLIVLAIIFSLPIFYWQRLYHFTWIYVGLTELYQIIKAVTFSTALIATALFIFRDIKPFAGFPRSIIFINYFLTLLAISGSRIGKRFLSEGIRQPSKEGRKVLIIGAGEAGEELARSIIKTRGCNLIGFIDDAEAKQNTSLHGYPVLGKRENLPEIIKKYEVEEIIIALPLVEPSVIRETIKLARDSGIQKIKTLPGIQEIIDGKVALADVREVSIEDLLGREKVSIDTQLIKNFISGKIILVTGAAGSIGSHLCEQILKFKPEKLIAFDQNETGIFNLERNLEKKFPSLSKIFEIGDICDENKMNWLFENTKPEIVFHAAAYKHVPLMEAHPVEAVKNNVFGTLIVGRAAINHNVENFVFVSTDKAVNPTSAMGATKQVGEMICRWLNKKSGTVPIPSTPSTSSGSPRGIREATELGTNQGQSPTRFCAVRFGNVLDSQGNVVGIFEEQIKAGGPVEITHPEMRRYFMVTSEACLLVMQAGALSQGGEVFVLDMGQPIKVVDLAREMIKLAGYEPDVDIPIVFTKMRPGEKLFEEILTENEMPTKHEKIFIAKLSDFDEQKLLKGLNKLESTLNKIDKDGIIEILKELIPTYQPNK